MRHFTYDTAGRFASITVDGLGTRSSPRRVRAAPEPDHARRQPRSRSRGTTSTSSCRYAHVARCAVHHLTIDVDALGRPRRINGVDIDPGATAPVAVAGVVGARRPRLRPPHHQFLSADPLMAAPASNSGASAYTYAWHDPVNHIDPTGLQPISIADYERMRTLKEQGRLGSGVAGDPGRPVGTLAMVGVVGAAFVIGGPVGVGIVVGAGMMAATGLATGTFSPRNIAIGGRRRGPHRRHRGRGAGVGAAMLGNGAVAAGSSAAQQLGSERDRSAGGRCWPRVPAAPSRAAQPARQRRHRHAPPRASSSAAAATCRAAPCSRR